jgi:cardiolipin synthase
MDLTDALSWTSLYLISEWIIRLLMLVIIPFRRSPEAAKGWLLFGFFLPWPALALYLLIGRPAYPKWRHMQFAKLPHVLRDEVDRVRKLSAHQEHPIWPKPHG